MTTWLSMQTPDGGARRFVLSAVRTTIGRGARCDLRIALPSVALIHCEIVNDAGTLTLKNLDTEMGTVVNGGVVTAIELSNGDRIEVGPVRFIVHIGEPMPFAEPTTEVKPQRAHEERRRSARLQQPDG